MWESSRAFVHQISFGTRCAAGVACALVLVSVAPAAAQAVARSFEELRFKVKAGDTIYITDERGREQTARILDLSGSSLIASIDGARRELTEANVGRIRQRLPDPLWTGALIGAGVGVALGGFAASFSEECSHDSGSCAGSILGAAASSAAVGIGIDALIKGKKTIYSRPSRASTAQVLPVFSANARGVRVQLSF